MVLCYQLSGCVGVVVNYLKMIRTWSAVVCTSSPHLILFMATVYNESTAGADASVEVPKLHNIKLLIASFYTHIDYHDA